MRVTVSTGVERTKEAIKERTAGFFTNMSVSSSLPISVVSNEAYHDPVARCAARGFILCFAESFLDNFLRSCSPSLCYRKTDDNIYKLDDTCGKKGSGEGGNRVCDNGIEAECVEREEESGMQMSDDTRSIGVQGLNGLR